MDYGLWTATNLVPGNNGQYGLKGQYGQNKHNAQNGHDGLERLGGCTEVN